MALNINGTTGISGVDGSVSAPAVTGTDSNTGITFPSADTIKFSTGGVERLAISNSGLSGDGSGLTGVSAGKLLQAVTATSTSSTFNYTTTLANTGLSASITPSATSSKILVMVSQTYIFRRSSSAFGNSILIYRDSTLIMNNINGANYHNHYNSSGGSSYIEIQGTWNHTILDSPNTTSATTYKTMFAVDTPNNSQLVGVSNDGKQSFITLLEIGA